MSSFLQSLRVSWLFAGAGLLQRPLGGTSDAVVIVVVVICVRGSLIGCRRALHFRISQCVFPIVVSFGVGWRRRRHISIHHRQWKSMKISNGLRIQIWPPSFLRSSSGFPPPVSPPSFSPQKWPNTNPRHDFSKLRICNIFIV